MRVELRRIGFSYPSRPDLLRDLSMTIDPAAFHVVEGPSGSGKSTLLRLINRLAEPTSGTLLVDDRPLAELDVAGWRRRAGYLQQTPVMIPGTVRENLLLPFRFRIAREQAIPSDAELLARLASLDLAGVQLTDTASSLSIGEQQRLAFARLLAVTPELLLCDEPTSALDAESASIVTAQLTACHAAGTAVVLVSHADSAWLPAAAVRHRLDDGKLQRIGTGG